jgi:hypothetical protein
MWTNFIKHILKLQYLFNKVIIIKMEKYYNSRKIRKSCWKLVETKAKPVVVAQHYYLDNIVL